MKATAVECNGAASALCNVTLLRGAGGDEIGGVKLVFSDGVESNVVGVPGDISVLETKLVSEEDSGLANPNKVEVIVYFVRGGKEQLCTNPSPFEF